MPSDLIQALGFGCQHHVASGRVMLNFSWMHGPLPPHRVEHRGPVDGKPAEKQDRRLPHASDSWSFSRPGKKKGYVYRWDHRLQEQLHPTPICHSDTHTPPAVGRHWNSQLHLLSSSRGLRRVRGGVKNYLYFSQSLRSTESKRWRPKRSDSRELSAWFGSWLHYTNLLCDHGQVTLSVF